MSGIAARSAALLVLTAVALAFTASGGTAAGTVHTGILGVVPHGSRPAPATHTLSKAIRAAAPSALTFDASYESLINRFLADVAHDSGGTQNVYSVATQYYDNPPKVPVQYQSTFGGSYVAHDPLPANGCDDAHNGFHDQYCLTDEQLQIEIQAAMAAKGWQGGLSHVFFLMTPEGVGSCTDVSGKECSTNAFCAYHSAFGPTISDAVLYTNEPYMGPLPPGDCTATDQGFPNNDRDAETTINTISHEHNEAITDPLTDAGLAWIAPDGAENGDLCAYGFGPQIGTSGVDAYNQVINGHRYDLQQEYSNQDGGCVQRLGGPATPPLQGDGIGPLFYHGGPVMHTNTTYAIYWLPTPGNTTPPVVTGAAALGHTLETSPGAWNGAPTGYHYQWQRCSSAGTDCVVIAGATSAGYRLTAADAGHTVRSTVAAANVNGTTAAVPSSTTSRVVAVPKARKAPHISGRARVGKKLSASRGSWTYSPTRYRFQWLRCSGRGTRCTSIRHATHPRYRLTKRDAKHRLRLRVTAINAAGSRKATSKASARVPLKR